MPIDNINNVTISMLKINLHTNIPSNVIVELTYNMLYQPNEKKTDKKLNLYYPFFTFDMKYSSEILYSMTYEERKQFFFNYDKYVEVLKDMLLLQNTSSEEEEVTENIVEDEYNFKKTDSDKKKEIINEYLNEYNEELYKDTNENEFIKKTIKDIDYERKENSDYNISLMLEVLFPTTFPTVNNVNDSYNEYIKGSLNTKLSIKGEVPSIIQPLFSGIQLPYSYLNINSSIHTVVRTLWLNDLLNNPKYKELIIKFNKFYDDNHEDNNFLEKKVIKISRTAFNNFKLLDEDTFDSIIEDFENDISIREQTEEQYVNKKNISFFYNIYTLIGLLRKIYSKIFKIKKNKDYSKKKLLYLLDVIDNIDYIYKNISDNIQFPYYIKKFINDLLRETSLPRTLNKILKVDKTSIKNITAIDTTDEDNKEIVNSLESIYPSYIDFLTLLNKFVEPNYQSTHLHLQKVINDYVKGINGDLYDLIKNYIKTKFLLDSPTDLLLEQDPSIKPEIFNDYYLYTGLNFSTYNSNYESSNKEKEYNEEENYDIQQGGDLNNDSDTIDNTQLDEETNNVNQTMDLITYEIDVLIDLIGGKIDDDNINNINCKYKSESFGDMFVKLINKKYPWSIDKNRFYITVDELINTKPVEKPRTLKKKYKLNSKYGGNKKYSRKYIK